MAEQRGDAVANADQKKYWSSKAGNIWIEHEDQLESLTRNVTHLLVSRVDPALGETILEIGCGTGEASIVLAGPVGPEGRVLATDISELLLARADERFEQSGCGHLSSLLADAQVHDFGENQFDIVASRFGTMFFENPVKAFANLRRSLRVGGRLCMICWAPVENNPWFTAPRDAAISRLGTPPPAGLSGPLAFSERDIVFGILQNAGFEDVAAEKVTVDLTFPGTAKEGARLACAVGPAARIMKNFQGGPEDFEAIVLATAKKFEAFQGGDKLCLPADVWVYTAKKFQS